MLKSDKAKKIISILNKIYPETPIPLNHKNNFELLISVLLSAQCTDKRVNEVTPLLLRKQIILQKWRSYQSKPFIILLDPVVLLHKSQKLSQSYQKY